MHTQHSTSSHNKAMFAFVLVCLLLVASSNAYLLRTPTTSLRHPLSSALFAAKFDPSTFVTVSVKKPLGLGLEEVELDKPRGVTISEVKDGNSKASGKIRSGLFLISINGVDVKYATFDAILDLIGNADESKPVDLCLVDPNDVFNGKALLSVVTAEGKQVKIECRKGQMLRDVLLGSGVEVYAGREKLTNCGGGLQCGTCVVDVSFNDDWERRVDIEALRLKKYAPTARLSCNTIVEGDAVIRVKPEKIA